MGVFKKGKGRLALALIGGIMFTGLSTGCKKEEVPPDPLAGYRMAVVDLKPLVELHPDFPKLEQLDQEIGQLQQDKVKIERQVREKIISKGAGIMDEAVEKARKKLEAEKNAIDGEIAALNNRLSSELNAEMTGIQDRLSRELEAEVARLKKQMGGEKPDAAPVIETNNNQQVEDYVANLKLVRERNLAARRLELEKRVGDEIGAKQAEVGSLLAAHEADLAAQYQSERLNLQLTAQNSTDEEAKAKAEARLSEISQAIADSKDAKRTELEAGFSALRAEKMTQVQGELESYQRELDQEVARNVASKQKELGMRVSQPVAPAPSGPPPEIQNKIDELQARMAGTLESKKAELSARMNAKMAEAQERLMAKQAEVEKSLEELNTKVQKDIERQLAELPEEQKTEIKAVDEKIAALQDESKKLYDSIREEIDGQVADIAKDKQQEMVVGTYQWVTPDFQDLTDLSQVRIQTMSNKG